MRKRTPSGGWQKKRKVKLELTEGRPIIASDLRYHACYVLRLHFDGVPFAVLRLVCVEGGQDHSDGYEQRRVCELFAGADAPSEPEGDVVRVELGLVAEETLWFELVRVLVRAWVVCEPPSCARIEVSIRDKCK